MAASTQDSDELISGINVTPLVDVILVVLVIFVVTASLVLRTTVPVELPSAATAEQSSTSSLIVFTITSDGVLYIDGRRADLADIEPAVAAARQRLGGSRAPSAVVAADVASRYGDFATIVDRLRLAGVSDIALDATARQVRTEPE